VRTNNVPLSSEGPGPDDLIVRLRGAGIHDERLLDAFRQVPRELFVPAESRPRAYMDVPLPIAHGQVTTQPSLLAVMVQALALRGDERVLEVGTGLGFQTAILASLCREVVSIEWFPDLARQADTNVRTVGLSNVEIKVGDGSIGFDERSPYDAIVVAAAAPGVSEPLVEQLADGGRLVQPLGPGGNERVTAFVKRAGQLAEPTELTGAHFVPLRGAFGIQ
jgi:protein-L-isoaspartate(D-aspartate) O-methyltransferase